MTPEESPNALGPPNLRDSAAPSLPGDGPESPVSDEDDSIIMPSLPVRRTRLLPDDLVDNDSTNEESDGSVAPENACSNEDISSTVEEENKVGRWTHSKGGSRKPTKSRTSACSKHLTPNKLANIELHRESQRLLREANIELIEHRPKQFSRFSEFRRSLHETSSTGGLSGSTTTDITEAPVVSEHKCISESLTDAQVDGTEPEVFNGGFPLDPLQTTPAPVTTPISKLLPAILPPVFQLDKYSEDVIDLGDALPSEVQYNMTPADHLMARLKKHVHTPAVKINHGPIEYSVVTKVMDEGSGTEQLRVESVVYELDKPAEAMTGSQRRERWRQHREMLREQMRQRRLEQYEARLKEVEHKTQTTANVAEQAISDEDDCEWSEGEDEVSSEDESNTSSSTTSKSNSEDEDVDDDVVLPSRRPRTCAFADDEAEESSNEGDDDAYLMEPEDDGASVMEESRGRPCPLRSAIVRYNTSSSTCEKQDVLPQFKCGVSTLARTLEMDEFTDLPTQSQEPPTDSGPIDEFSFSDIRRPQGSLGPGDVDLFISDYSAVLDRPPNIPSVLTSTRLDTTIPLDNSKFPASHLALETPSCSNWSNTPYELLFSQRPISQPSSLSKESSPLTTNTTEPHMSASQDTVLLSQASDAEITLRAPYLPASSFQESQEEHARRHQLFATPSFSSDYLDGEFLDVGTSSNAIAEKPITQEVESDLSLNQPSPKKVPTAIPSAPQQEHANDPTYPLSLAPTSPTSLSDRSGAPDKTENLPTEFNNDSRSESVASPLPAPQPTDLPVLDGPSFLHSSEAESKTPVRRHRIILEDDEDAVLSPPTKPTLQEFTKVKLSESDAVAVELMELPSNMSTSESDESDAEPVSTEDEGSDEKETSETENAADDIAEFNEQSAGSESDEEEAQRMEILGNKPKSRKIFRAEKFLDEEAELSGDENERAYYMDGDEDIGSDNEDFDDMELVDDENLPSAGRLRRQVERVHHRLQADQDQRELRFLKELYFEDGDLHAESGRTRERRFRWRGLENDDPIIDSFEDLDDHQSSDDADVGINTPLGPMDRWIKTGLARNPPSEDAHHVDLDARTEDRSQHSDYNASDDTEGTAPGCDADEEKENTNDTQNSVSSIGRKAVLKAKTHESQVMFVSVNKRVLTQPKRIKHPKAPQLLRSQTLTEFFQNGRAPVKDTSSNSTMTALPPTPCPHGSVASSTVPSENRGKISKRGSLLARVPLLTRCASVQIISEIGDADPILGVDEDSLSNSSQLSCRQSQVHFLGLRNKVGMSCFSVLSQPITSTDQPGSLPKPPTGPLVSGKRPLAELNPSNVKRQRSTSVFSALL